MKKTTATLALALLAAFMAPAQAASFGTAAEAKQLQGEQLAKKGKKAPKSKKSKA